MQHDEIRGDRVQESYVGEVAMPSEAVARWNSPDYVAFVLRENGSRGVCHRTLITRNIAMSLKQGFADQVKGQSEVWKAQIKDFQEQLEQASAKGQAEYMKMVAQLEEKAAEAMKMFERVQAANETAWKDMQTATQKAFAELQKGWAEALSRFE